LTTRAVAGHLIAALATYVAVAPFLAPTLGVVEAPISAAQWLLVALSAAANVMVLTYHHLVPAHPKFTIVSWRRAILLIHIASGTLEFAAGLAALALGGHALAGVTMALVALLFHVPSALAQTPTVFGSRAIMRPSYLMAIGLHAWCAVQLWLHPTSLYWTVATFLLFNTYVWVRVFFYLLDKFGFFEGAKYTVAVLLAGLTTTPTVLGPTAMTTIAIGWAVFIAVHSAIFIRTRAELHDFIRERARDSAYSEGVRAMWDRSDAQTRSLAAEFFALLDTDADGHIEPDELEGVLARANVPTHAVRHFMESRGEGGRLPFDLFFAHLWPIPELRRAAREVVFTWSDERSDRDKAEFVFRRLDLDGDGHIDRRELDELLTEWSLPPGEVLRWTRRLGLRDDQDINFDVFLVQMRPLWRFIYYDVIEARHGSGDDLIQRVFAAWRDDSEVRTIAHDLRTSLVRRVDLLQAADDAFIAQLAACFVEEHADPGVVLFEEGGPGDEFFIIRSGRVRVHRGPETLAVLGEGDWLGEGALLSRSARSASAVVTAECVLYRASAASFDYLLERHPDLRAAMEKLHEERRVDRAGLALRADLLHRVPFLAGASEPLLRGLAERLVRLEADGVVLREGEPGDELFLISAGSVRIEREGELLTELPPGAFFGEGALLSHAARSATALAAPGTVLYALHRADFEWLAAQHPPAREQIAARHGDRRG
jgi:CRP-like cAMP-binding protein/Ca2+-binding EF-hand superfamily protein